MATEGSKAYKRAQFNVLADFYAKIGKRNKKLLRSKDVIIAGVEEANALEAADSLIKSARSAKSILIAQTAVLEKLYAKPLFAGSKIDFLGRSIARTTVGASGMVGKVDRGVKAGTKSVKKLVTRRLNKPILIVIGIAGATGVGAIYNAFRHQLFFSKQDSSGAEAKESDVKAGAISKVEIASSEQYQELASSQFYHSAYAAFSMDESVDKSVDSVRYFVKELALYLNTNLLEDDLKITKLCFPINKEDEHLLSTESSRVNKKEYCQSI